MSVDLGRHSRYFGYTTDIVRLRVLHGWVQLKKKLLAEQVFQVGDLQKPSDEILNELKWYKKVLMSKKASLRKKDQNYDGLRVQLRTAWTAIIAEEIVIYEFTERVCSGGN